MSGFSTATLDFDSGDVQALGNLFDWPPVSCGTPQFVSQFQTQVQWNVEFPSQTEAHKLKK
jgi:hypothetical protein